MAVVREMRDERLRLGGIAGTVELDIAGVGRTTIRRKPGVLVFEDIYPGAVVSAQVDFPGPGVLPQGSRPTDPDINVAGRVGDPTPEPLVYRFEVAPVPDADLPGGGVVRRTVKRIIIPPTAASGGPALFIQPVPIYAAFAPPVGGTLYQKGRQEHLFTVPGLVAGTGDNVWFVRVRWEGVFVGPVVLVTGTGEQLFEGIAWASNHTRLAPGSITIGLPSGGTLRDDGRGRLVSADDAGGDGVIDYVTGAYQFRTQQAETGDINVTYEHSTPYHPLDVHLSWDARAQ